MCMEKGAHMDGWRLKAGPGVPGWACDLAREAFGRELAPLAPHLARIAVILEAGGRKEGPGSKTLGARIDFRSGGRLVVEATGEDWDGLADQAAWESARSAEGELLRRWEIPEGRARPVGENPSALAT
jgi:hypothetical protein